MSALTITRHTFHEAHRRWVMWAVAFMGLAFLVLYAIGLWLIQREFESSTTMPAGEIFEAGDFFLLAGLYAVDFLVVVLAILVSVDTISGEITSGTVQTIVTRPIRRWEVIVGKWLGLSAMLGLWSVLMSAAVIGLSWWITGYVPNNPVQGVALIALAGIVALTVSIAGGTRLSTLTNGVLVFMLYGIAFIGGWIEQFGALLRNTTSVNVGILISLLMPAEAMWKRAAYLMEPPVLRQLGVHPFAAISAPSPAMVVYAVLFVITMLGLAVVLFSRRDL